MSIVIKKFMIRVAKSTLYVIEALLYIQPNYYSINRLAL